MVTATDTTPVRIDYGLTARGAGIIMISSE
jgi:hypothetical protein